MLHSYPIPYPLLAFSRDRHCQFDPVGSYFFNGHVKGRSHAECVEESTVSASRASIPRINTRADIKLKTLTIDFTVSLLLLYL